MRDYCNLYMCVCVCVYLYVLTSTLCYVNICSQLVMSLFNDS